MTVVGHIASDQPAHFCNERLRAREGRYRYCNGPVRAASGAHGDLTKMLWTIAVILLVLWLLGLVSSYTAGGLIHILLVVALVVIVIQVIQGRRI